MTALFLFIELSLERFPYGKNLQPKENINPGNNIFFINPFWEATVYFTEDWALSWELAFVANGTNEKTAYQGRQCCLLRL